MKTTLDIDDALCTRAKRLAKRRGTTLRAIVEEGLRQVLTVPAESRPYTLPDFSVGDRSGPDPLGELSSDDLRALLYEPDEASTARQSAARRSSSRRAGRSSVAR